MTRIRPLLPLVAALTAPLAAQGPVPEGQAQPPPERSFLQRVAGPGKWVVGAGAIALIGLAVREHNRANESWDALLNLCEQNNESCELAADGTYKNLDAERLYQESQYYDRRAQRRILGGQVGLVLAAVLLIVDLSDRRDGPNNVPFDPERAYVAPAADGGVLLGMRVKF
jgi:hypothetical protein